MSIFPRLSHFRLGEKRVPILMKGVKTMRGIWSYQGLMQHRVIMYMLRRRGKGRRAGRWYHEQPPNLSSERTTSKKKEIRLLLLAFLH